MTWNESGCNDFMTVGCTVCHVPVEYYDSYVSKFSGVVNATFKGDLVDLDLDKHIYGHSITLDGGIGVNFCVEFNDELLKSDTAKILFNIPNGRKTETQELLIKDVYYR